MGRFVDLVRQAGLPSGSPLQRALFAISQRIETTIQAVQITSPAPNTNSLRVLPGTPGSITVLVDPVFGGPFSYSNVPAVDDGATVFNAGGLGSNMAGWRRVYSGFCDFRWYQPDRTGVADCAPAFNAALNYLNRQNSTIPGGVPGNGLMTVPTLFVPGGGAYRVASTVGIGAYTRILGDHGAMVFSTDPTISLFSSYNYYNTFSGLAFIGGRHAVTFYGPQSGGGPSVGGPNWFERCTWRYQHGPSLFQDTQSFPGNDRGMSATVIVDTFSFQGACFWWGGSDQAVFKNGHLIVDHGTLPAYFDGPGARLLPGFMNTGVLDLEDVMAVPLYTGGKNSAWIEGNGIISSRRTRFGGEDSLLPYRLRTDPSKMVYNGFTAPSWLEALTELSSDLDPQASTNGRHFIEIYDRFPARIDVRRVLPFSLSETGRNYAEFANPDLSIWIDKSTCPVGSFQDSSRTALRVFFDTESKPRFVTGANPADAQEDITHVFAQFRRKGPEPDLEIAQENLWPAGPGQLGPVQIDPSWGYFGIFNQVTVSDDTTLGYAVRKWTSNQNSQGANVYATCGVNATTFWGAGLEPGVYTVSILVKANWSGTLNFLRDISSGAMGSVRFEASEDWQRLAWTFSHDGGNHLLGFSVYSMPGLSDPRGPGSVAFAQPAVHRGTRVAKYTRPGNATVPGFTRSTYYGTSAPVSGTYMAGDNVINTTPVAGGWTGWICTAGGSPGVWKGYGAIEA